MTLTECKRSLGTALANYRNQSKIEGQSQLNFESNVQDVLAYNGVMFRWVDSKTGKPLFDTQTKESLELMEMVATGELSPADAFKKYAEVNGFSNK